MTLNQPQEEKSAPAILLGPLLRRGRSPRELSVWVEVSAACEVTVLGASSPTFCVAGRHYAIVELPEQVPGLPCAYTVHLDDELAWPDVTLIPEDAAFEPWSPGTELRIAGGSCRQQAPQATSRNGDMSDSTPTTDELGADALAALAQEVLRGARQLPHLLLLTGDQVYADEQHPTVKSYLDHQRGGPPDDGDPQVTSFVEYAWLYQRTWSHPMIRWLLASVPSLMIFDDHDVIDDWNISDTWAADIAKEPWWQDRLDAALMSYWVYQHLGNMSADERADDELFAAVRDADDGEAILRQFAARVGTGPERYETSWSYNVDFGEVNVIVLDARNGRVLEPDARSMLSPRDWRFLDHALAENPNVLIVSSVPWLLPLGVHSLEKMVSRMVHGRWGGRLAKLGEKIRREIDLEHWAAFGRSVEALTARLRDAPADAVYPPVVFSGDVHFAYIAEQTLKGERSAYQVVSSPLRQGDAAYEQAARWAAMTTTFDKLVRWLAGRGLRRSAPKPKHTVVDGVWTHNNIAQMTYDKTGLTARIDRAELGDDGLILKNLVSRKLR